MQQKIKIFHIIHALKIGGVEKAALSSLELLNSHYDFRLLVIDKDLSIVEVSDSIKKSIVTFDGQSPIDILNYFKIIQYINREKPNIIISSLWRSIFITFLTKAIFRDFIWISFFHSTSFKHFWDKLFNQIGFRLSNYILVDSNKASDFISKWINKDKVAVISFLTHKSQSVRAIEFLDLRMVYIGRINSMKGIEVGIQLQHYLLEYHNIKLPFDIYGPDENFLDTLNFTAHDLGISNFKYCGTLAPNRVSETLQKYNLFFQASQYEGMAMSVVEAMQQGLVCIVRPVGEIQNYSKHLISAIHIQKQQEYNFAEIVEILNNKFLLSSVSENASNTFSNHYTYSESLIHFLEKQL